VPVSFLLSSAAASGLPTTEREREEMEDDTNRTVLAQFFSADGFATGPQLDLPLETTTEQLELLLNDLLAHVRLSPSLMAALPPCCWFFLRSEPLFTHLHPRFLSFSSISIEKYYLMRKQ
jgi:hypothetical protein